MADNRILVILKEKLSQAVEEKDALLASFKSLNEKIESKMKRAVKKPSLNADAIDEKIAELEFKLSHASHSVNEEKSLLRDISTLKTQKSGLSVAEAYQTELSDLKNQRNEVGDQLRERQKLVRELRDAVRKIEVLDKITALNPGLPVSFDSLTTVEVPVGDDVLPRLIGRKGQQLRDIENVAGVVLDVIDPKEREREAKDNKRDGIEESTVTGTTVRITGLANGIAKATSLIQGIANEIEKDVTVSSGLASYLLSRTAAAMQALETAHTVKLRAEPRTGAADKDGNKRGASVAPAVNRVLHVRGSAAAVANVEKALKALEAGKSTIVLDARTLPGVIGKAGVNLKAIREAFPAAEVDVVRVTDKEGNTTECKLDVYGDKGSVAAATAALKALVMEHTETENAFPIPRDAAPWLVGKSGERIQSFQKDTGAFVRVDKGESEDAVTKVVIRGTSTAMAKAIPMFSTLMLQYSRCNQHLVIPANQAKALVGAGGANIEALRTSTGATIDVIEYGTGKTEEDGTKKAPRGAKRAAEMNIKLTPNEAIVVVRVSTIEEASKIDLALAAIKSAMVNYSEITVRVPPGVIAALVTNKGELINRIQKDTSAVLDIVRPQHTEKDKETGETKTKTSYRSVADIVISGISAGAVVAARAEIEKMAASFSERIVELPDAYIIGEIVGKAGAAINEFKTATGLEDIDVDKASLTVRLVGPVEALDAASAKLKEMFATYASLNSTIRLDKSLVPGFIGKGGANVRKIQEETGATINTSADSGEIRIHGITAEAVNAAKAKIVEMCKLDKDQFTMDIPTSTIGGKGGANVRKLEAEFDVSIAADTTTGHFVIRGDVDKIAACRKAVRRIVRDASRAEVEITVRSDRMGSVIGTGGSRIRTLEGELDVSIDVPTKDKEGETRSIRVRGTEAGLIRARAVLESISNNKVVRILPRPAGLVRELRADSKAFADIMGTAASQGARLRLFDDAPAVALTADDAEDAAQPCGGLFRAATGTRPVEIGYIVIDAADQAGQAASQSVQALVARIAAAVDKYFATKVAAVSAAKTGVTFDYVTLPGSLVQEYFTSWPSKEDAIAKSIGSSTSASVDKDANGVALWSLSADAVRSTRAALETVAAPYAARTGESNPVSEPWMVSALTQGKLLTALEKETSSSLSIGSKDGVTRVLITASDAASLPAAKAKVDEALESLLNQRAVIEAPVNAFGAVIGKAGSVVKKIQEDANSKGKPPVTVDFDRDRSIIIIRPAGASLASLLSKGTETTAETSPLACAVDAVMNILEEAAPGEVSKLSTEEGTEALNKMPAPKATRSVTGLSADEIAAVIGNRGSRVRKLEQDFGPGLSIDIDRDGGVVKVTGTEEDAVASAVDTIMDIVEEARDKARAEKAAKKDTSASAPVPVKAAVAAGPRRPIGAPLPSAEELAAEAAKKARKAAKKAAKKGIILEEVPVAAPVVVPAPAPLPVYVAPVVAAPAPAPVKAAAPVKVAAPAPVKVAAPAPVVVAAPAPAPIKLSSADETLAKLLGPEYVARLASLGFSPAGTSIPIAAPAPAPVAMSVGNPKASLAARGPPPGLNTKPVAAAAPVAANPILLPGGITLGASASAALAGMIPAGAFAHIATVPKPVAVNAPTPNATPMKPVAAPKAVAAPAPAPVANAAPKTTWGGWSKK